MTRHQQLPSPRWGTPHSDPLARQTDGVFVTTGLRRALDEAVSNYFVTHQTARHGGALAQRKASLVVFWLVSSYLALVFWAHAWWQVLPLALSLALAMTAIGFVIAHEANHGALCASERGNRWWRHCFDIMGISSYVWRHSHNFDHHGQPNVEGRDPDLDFGCLARMSPAQPRRRWHRFQHVYLPLIYGFSYPRWVVFQDFQRVCSGRIAKASFPRPRGVEALIFVAGKLGFLAWAVLIPALMHPPALVLAVGLGCGYVVGVVLALVVSLGHSVDGIGYPSMPIRSADDWCAHQILASADFGTTSRALTWFTGGLNHQITHHLYPRISHVHHRALAPALARVYARFGLLRTQYPSFLAALAAHLRHLRKLGTTDS